MKRRRTTLVFILLTLGIAVAGCGDDSSGSSATTGGITVPSGGVTVNVEVSDTVGTDGPETLVPDPVSVAAGDVTFTVENTGTIKHEVVALKTDVAFDQLPVGESEADKVDEATSVGEVEVEAGETGSFTVTGLEAGKYVLVCNIAKHYALGMRAAFTVT